MAVNLSRPWVGCIFAKGRPVDITPVTGTSTLGVPLVYSISPALPEGLTMNPQTGQITGTPSLAVSLTEYVVDVSEANVSYFVFNDIVSSNMNNYNLRNRAIAAGWNGTQPLNATVTINAGVFVRGSNANTPAWTVATVPEGQPVLPAGSLVRLNAYGSIWGYDAVGDEVYGGYGLKVNYPVSVLFQGGSNVIAGGSGTRAYGLAGEGGNTVIPFGQDHDGQGGWALDGGQLVTWLSGTDAIHRVHGRVNHWGTFEGDNAGNFNRMAASLNAQLCNRTGYTNWSQALPLDWYWRNSRSGWQKQPEDQVIWRVAYVNTTGIPMTVKLYGCADDELVQVFVNGGTIDFGNRLTYWDPYDSTPFVIPPGVSVIELRVNNYGFSHAGMSLELRNMSDQTIVPRWSWNIINW